MAEPATDEDFTSQISGTLDPENYCEAGAFGEVYRRTIQSNKGPMEVAVKVFKIDAGIEKERIKKGIYRELKVWLRLKHTTIVPLLGTANVDSPFPALVSQWMPSGTLYVYLKQPTTISASARVELARGVAKGLKYLHSENVVHGDLHPANVLIDSFGSPRLTDFGLAAVPGDADLQLSTMTASRTLDSRWRAPEVIGIDRDPERPTFKSDIYSFGGVMFFITSGDVPWKDKKHSHQITIELSRKTAPARPDHILDDHWKLIKQCWSWDPVDRPGAAEVIGCIPRVRRKIIVLFGETGAGKSSLLNLMAGHEVANTSPDTQLCTMKWKEYTINIDGESYQVFDTIGLLEPQLEIALYLEIVENAYRLIKELDRQGGIDLLLYCVRAGRFTAATQSNYRLFHEFFCQKKVPIVLAITNLEREQRMEDWWERNQSTYEKYQIQVAGHACITAANRLDGRHRELYEESRVTIRNLVKVHTADGQKQAWIGEDNLMLSPMLRLKQLLAGSSHVRREDMVTLLMKRCGLSQNVAKQLADMIKQE